MQHAISGPLGSGAAAYPWPAPRRGEFDELVLDGLVYAAPTGFRPLSMELRVEQGRGYQPARTAAKEAIGTIPIDALRHE